MTVIAQKELLLTNQTKPRGSWDMSAEDEEEMKEEEEIEEVAIQGSWGSRWTIRSHWLSSFRFHYPSVKTCRLFLLSKCIMHIHQTICS
jgi:hypothetical protein